MKTLQLAAAALAVGVLAFPAKAATSTNGWWNVTFEADSFQNGFEGLTEGELGALTNRNDESQNPPKVQPYAEGYWLAAAEDESFVTNSYYAVTNNGNAFGDTTCIKLDTQGTDLQWIPEDDNAMPTNAIALVDADLYLVGSESEPDVSSFDNSHDVQTAIYLKNELYDDSDTEHAGATSNSVLCVYAWNPDLNGGEGACQWIELDGVDISDNSWAHVQVIVDHTSDEPLVRVFVNGTQMHARGDATMDSWPAANLGNSIEAGKVNSVAFRGTGAVDNFVGKHVTKSVETYNFTANVYMDDVLQAAGNDGNLTRTVPATSDVGDSARFEGFILSNFDYENVDTNATWALSKIELIDPVSGAVTATYNFTYDWGTVTPGDIEGVFETFKDEFENQQGPFSVTAPTAGATGDALVAKIYFATLGSYEALAETVIDGVYSTNSIAVSPDDFAGGATKTVSWEFPATKDGTVLSTIRVYGDAQLEYANGKATVSTNLTEVLAANTLFVTATYVTGSLDEGQDLVWTEQDGVYTFTPYTPPVAIIVAGNVTNEYPSLRAAVAAASLLAEPVTIQLVADDAVSFTADAPILDIEFEVTIDGGSNTLYGMTGYAAGLHEIRIGGSANVTIKDLKLTEFGDTATRSSYVMPLVARGAYTGKLTLDGVQIDKFNRQALCLFGGTFEITNCVITGLAEGTEYFQSAIEVFNASGTVADTTISGIGSNLPDWGAASCFTLNSDWSQTPWVGGTGSITILSGSYTGQYIALGMTNAAQTVEIQGGTFVATAPATESAFGLDGQSNGDPSAASVTITGGWFDREPEAKFLAKGYRADEAAPGTATPWTVVLGNAIWIGGASGDWNVPANWDNGLVPTTTTVVTFTNNAQVGISPGDCCKEMVLDNADVEIGRANQGTGADLSFYKNAGDAVSGTGTLSLNNVGMFNQNKSGVLKICSGLSILGDVTFKGVKDDNQHAGSWTVTNNTTIANGVTVKSIDDAITTFQGDIDIASGATVTFFAAFGHNENYHGGEIVVDSSSTVTLAHHVGDPATKLVLETRNKGKITINGQVVTDSADYYVKSTSTTYEALPKPTVYVTATDGNVTNVTGVANGDRVEPGTQLTIGVFVVEGYSPSVTITNNAGTVLLTTNAASFAYTMPESDIGVTFTAVQTAIEPTAVDPGTSLTAADKEAGHLPVKVTANGFEVSFRSSQPNITYQLVYSTTLTVADWTACSPAGDPVTSAADTSEQKTELITLTAPMTENVQFFKIKASVPAGN